MLNGGHKPCLEKGAGAGTPPWVHDLVYVLMGTCRQSGYAFMGTCRQGRYAFLDFLGTCSLVRARACPQRLACIQQPVFSSVRFAIRNVPACLHNNAQCIAAWTKKWNLVESGF